MRFKLKIDGLKDFDKALGEFSKATARGIITRALKKAAAPIEAQAENNAPKATGQLKRSVQTVVIRQNAGKAAFAQAMRSGASRSEAAQAARSANRDAAGAGASATVRVQATAPHAHFIEFGTQTAPAQPFMGPAFQSGRGKAVSAIKTELGKEIDKAAKRAARRAARKME